MIFATLAALALCAPPTRAPAPVDAVFETVSITSFRGGDRVREGLRWRGLEVDGADRIVVRNPAGGLRRVHEPKVVLPHSAVPTLSLAEAVALVQPPAHRRLFEPSAVLVVRSGRLAWRVDLGVVGPITWRVYVDAHSGERFGTRRTSVSALGNVYPISPAMSDVAEVELQRLTSNTSLVGTHADVRSCDDPYLSINMIDLPICLEASAHASPDGSGDYLFEPDPGSLDDPFSEVQLYHHVDLIAAWAADRLAFDQDGPITVYTNADWPNAFWGDFDGDGRRDLFFGTADNGVDFSYDTDVVYHEFGHSILFTIAPTQAVEIDGDGIDFANGALHEGGADVFSMLLNGDPDLGEYAAGGIGRDVYRDARSDRSCPEDLTGDSHEDGLILGSLAWNLIDDPAVGPEVVTDLLVGAAAEWSDTAGWQEAADTLELAAADLLDAGVIDAPTRDAILGHIDATGIGSCDNVIVIDDDYAGRVFVYNFSTPAPVQRVGTDLHWKIEVPKRQKAVVSVELTGTAIGWAAYVREDFPVGHVVLTDANSGLGLPVPDAYTEEAGGSAEPGSFELASGTWYVSFAGVDIGQSEYLDRRSALLEVAVSFEEARGGCGCSQGGASGSWLLAGLAFLLRRRR
jgi:uncharacterized protein (TIGR03382 family)